MPLTPEEERRVERLLREAAEEGRRVGRSEAERRVIEARAKPILRRDYREALEILGRFDQGTLRDALYHMVRLFLPGSVARWRERMRPQVNDVAESATAGGEELLGPFDARRRASNDFLEDYVSELADQLAQTTYGRVMDALREAEREGLGVPQAAERLRENVEDLSNDRAKRIARNELQRITKGASWVRALESGLISGKIRREQDDERTRESHREIDGEERAIDEPYSNGELWAGQTDINCRGYDEFVPDWGAIEAGEGPAAPPDREPEERGDPDDEVRRFFEDPDAEASDEELEETARRIAARAARRGFDRKALMRASRDIVGLEWEGEELTRRSLVPMDVGHHLKHVVKRGEWPEDTDLDGYNDSVRDVVSDPETRVFVGRFEGREQVGFLRRSKELRGPRGRDWILVEYVLGTGHVHTAFQPERGIDWVLEDPEGKREILRWLREPE